MYLHLSLETNVTMIMADQFGNKTNFCDQVTEVSGRTSKLCEPCKKKNKQTTAVVFCKNCNQYQCSDCEKAHEIFDALSGHEIIDASCSSVVPPARNIPQLDLKGLDKCSRHDKVFEFLCVDHQALCCSSCAIELHRKCDEVNALSTEVAKSSVNVASLISTMKEMKARTSSVMEHVQETKVTMETQISDIPAQIDDIMDTVMNMFETLKQNVMKKAKTAEKEKVRELDIKTSTSNDIAQSLEKYVATLQTVVSQGSPVQIYIAQHVLRKQIEPYQSFLKEHQDSLHVVNLSVEYNNVLTSLLETGDTLFNLHVDKTYINADSQTEMKPTQLTLVTSMDTKWKKGDTKEPFYTGLAFLPDRRLVVIDKSNRKCYIMNEKLQKLGMYNFKSAFQNVAIISETEVAVTGASKDNTTIDILHVSKSNVITSSRTVKCSSLYNSIGLMNDTTFVVSTCDDKRPVRMISMTGEESDFPGLPEKEYKLGTSTSTYIRDRNIIVLSDRYVHAVYLYDVNNKKCMSRCVVKDENIREPRGVCVGPDHCIFVCSENTNSIVQVSLTGKVVSSHKVDMLYPRTVCVSPDGTKLAVSNSATGKVKLQVYSLQYTESA